MQILYIIVGVLAVWLLVLTILVVLTRLFFVKLGKDVGKDNLIKILQDISETSKKNSDSISEIRENISDIISADKLHIQKVGLVKFNPFEEVGGEHSFSLCLLNNDDTGVMFTGLHTRDRTRVYLKEVKNGKSTTELSKEEVRALKLAIKG